MRAFNKKDVSHSQLLAVPELPARIIESRCVFYTSSTAEQVYDAVWDTIYDIRSADGEYKVNEWVFNISVSHDGFQKALQHNFVVSVRRSRQNETDHEMKEWAAKVLAVETRIENGLNMLSQRSLLTAFDRKLKLKLNLETHPVRGNVADDAERENQRKMLENLEKVFPAQAPLRPLKIGEYIAGVRQMLHDLKKSPSMYTSSIIIESMYTYVQEDAVQDPNTALMLRILCGTHLEFSKILNDVRHMAGTKHTRAVLSLVKLLSCENEVAIAIATPKIVMALRTIALDACHNKGKITRFADVRDIVAILFNMMRIVGREMREHIGLYVALLEIYRHTPSKLIQTCIINGFESIH